MLIGKFISFFFSLKFHTFFFLLLINYRLTGPRGLDELCNLFQDEKFKGKGYEVSLIKSFDLHY